MKIPKPLKPLSAVKLELWSNSLDYLRYGLPWWKWLGLYIFQPALYFKLESYIRNGDFFARGVYDTFGKKVIICLDDIYVSLNRASSVLPEGTQINMQQSFILQVYYTLIHELLHHANVQKNTCADGHQVDFDKYEKLPMWLKLLFDDFLSLEKSGDAFGRQGDQSKGEDS